VAEKNKTHGKLEIKLGNLAFSGEGDQDWLTAQLQKLIDSAEALNKTPIATPTLPPVSRAPFVEAPATNGSFQDSLATYLKIKNAEKNQTIRFLATADWLRRRGEQNLSSGMVARALSENQQSRLANPSDCLNQNVKKGLCEKKNGGFFITPEGLKALG